MAGGRDRIMTEAAAVFQPLPGRTCGACTVCCVNVEIDDPELKKPDEVVCPNLLPAGGCGIYAARPRTCATWFCGWRLLNLSDAMRPDLSNVLLMPEICREPGYEKGGLRLVAIDGDTEKLLRREVIDLAGRCVANGVPIFLSCGSGAACKRGLLNPLAEVAVRAGARENFVAIVANLLGQLAAAAAAEKVAPTQP